MSENKANTNLSLKEKYELLIKARNFHYENYNKWMTYFYVAIAALFLGYCSILSKESPKEKELFLYPITILGFIVGLLWYWSSKGYYYWNINFINLINYYEATLLKFPVKERIYFVFANKKEQNNYAKPTFGANISTSKIAILFSFIITLVWGAILFYKLIYTDDLHKWFLIILSILFSLASIIFFSLTIAKYFLKSNQKDFTDLKIKLETMNAITPKIKMGNDEFILYLRKNKKGLNLNNDQLGKMIWLWLRDNANGVIIESRRDEPCRWGAKAENVADGNLPKTATQFEFDTVFLPELYSYLDSIV